MDANMEEVLQFHELGAKAYQTGEYQKAAEAYSQAIDDDLYDSFLYIKRAACYLKLKEFKLCIEDCEAALGMDDSMIEAWMIKGETCALLGDFKESKICIKKIRELCLAAKDHQHELNRLNNVERAMLSAIIAIGNKEYTQALTEIKNVFVLYPNLVVTKYVELLLKTDNVEEALQISNKFSERSVGDIRFYYFKGLALHYSGDSAAAKKIWNQAEKLSPKDLELIEALKKVRKQIKKQGDGVKALKDQKYELAIACFVEAIDQDPSNKMIASEFYYNIASANFKLKKYSETISDCNKAIEMRSTCAKAFLLRAEAKMITKQCEDAIIDFQKADQLDSSLGAKEKMKTYQYFDNSQSKPKETLSQGNFTKLNAITEKLLHNYVEVVAFVKKVGNIKEIPIPQKSLRMKEVSLMDDTGVTLKLVLWQELADKFSAKEGTLIWIKGAQVKRYEGAFQLAGSKLTEWVTSKAKLTSFLRVKELESWWEKENKANGTDIYDEDSQRSKEASNKYHFEQEHNSDGNIFRNDSIKYNEDDSNW